MTDNLHNLVISHFEKNTDLLGPYSRFVIWVHGCCFNCKGCLADDTKTGNGRQISIEELGDIILAQDIEGITISGGEPFLQAQPLSALISYIRKNKDLGVIIYTGFLFNDIIKDETKFPLLKQADILIDGRYEQDKDDGRAYIGSSNQKLYLLTDRYKNVAEEYYSAKKRRAEIKITKDQVILVGVPSGNVLSVWEDLKKKARGNIDDFGN